MKRYGEWFYMVIPGDWEDLTIEKVMKQKWKIPRKLRHDFRSNKKVTLNNHPPHWKTTIVKKGDELGLRLFQPSPISVPPVDLNLEILYEDDHILVVNKPAGVFTHPNGSDDGATLWNGISCYARKHSLPVLPKYIHRLDRYTSGAILFGKHGLAIATLGEMMKRRQISRTYIAKVHGRIDKDEGRIDSPIDKDPAYTTKRKVSEQGQQAITNYTVVHREKDCSLLRLQLETGRTHQIRVHLSSIGHPLLGDSLYGGYGDSEGRHSLHAASLSFVHPFTREDITCHASASSSPFFEEIDLD
ncbi:RluA family pseudouridine synthase [Salimicrobium sp. PL1-032A]|uniref:RluA family pseudouridine synthase n=1 Tax=Salimicrobium sp. PL1-032A TaxID=3095364 RepID=UPI003260061A